MKIYRVELDVNKYQSFYPNDQAIWKTNILTMDGQSKKEDWNSIQFHILQTNLKKGNFFGDIVGGLILDQTAKDKLAFFWEASGELLPFSYKGERYYLFNCLYCYNLLNNEKTDWVYGKSTNKKIRIKKYTFYPERLTETPLFKIPETSKGEILVAEGLKGEEDEFIYQVKKNNLKGLTFEEIWSN